MANILSLKNTSNSVIKVNVNTNKKVEEWLKAHKIPFVKNGKRNDLCEVELPAQSIVQVLDGENTQTELKPMVKGKVVKDVTNETRFLNSSSDSAELLATNKKLEDKVKELEDKIKELTASQK